MAQKKIAVFSCPLTTAILCKIYGDEDIREHFVANRTRYFLLQISFNGLFWHKVTHFRPLQRPDKFRMNLEANR